MGMKIEAVMKNSRLLVRRFSTRPWMAVCTGALALAFAASANAQAPPGPISGAPDTSPPAARASSRNGVRDSSKGKLEGDWKMDKALSDDPRQKMEKATGSPRGQVGTNGPWGGMGGGGHRGSGSGNAGGRAAKQAAEMTDDYSFLSIVQTETSVRVTSDSGRLLAYYSSSEQTNAQGSSQGNSKPADGNGSKTASTRMQGDQLVVVSSRDGVKTTRTFAGSADGSQLYLTSRIEGGHLKDPVTIRFVYNPATTGDEDTP
jgi:hypothetical protein